MEARPDPDTPAQMRAAVAKYLAANALKDKALSTEQQKTWAAREEKYRKEWEELGVWAFGVKVTTSLTTAAWEHTLKESEWATTRRANSKKIREKDSVDYREKREKYTYALLNAYNAAIRKEARKREGRPTDLSRQEKMVLKGLTVPPHVEERAAPLTLEGADVEGKGTPCGEDNTSLRNNTYPSLEENPPFPNNTRAPPPYGCYDHQAPRDSKGPALQFPILHIEKGPVEVLYNEQPPPSFAKRTQNQQQRQQQLQLNTQSYPAQNQQQQLQPNTQSYPAQNQQQQLQPNTQSYPAQNQQQQLQPNTQSYPAQNQQQQLQPNTQSYPAQNQQTEGRVAGTPHSPLQS
ncbi:unnamed protein product [Boreogadus saida]